MKVIVKIKFRKNEKIYNFFVLSWVPFGFGDVWGTKKGMELKYEKVQRSLIVRPSPREPDTKKYERTF